MRSGILFLFTCFALVSANAQTSTDRKTPIDQNHSRYISDRNFNNSNTGILLNNLFVKSEIGFDLNLVQERENTGALIPPYTVKGINSQQDSIVVVQDTRKHPIVINGVEYKRFVNFTIDKEIELITLEDIKKQHFPDIKEPYIFMVNTHFLTNDIESYKFDKDFIYRVELVSSDEFEALKDYPKLSIIKILTRTKDNM